MIQEQDCQHELLISDTTEEIASDGSVRQIPIKVCQDCGEYWEVEND